MKKTGSNFINGIISLVISQVLIKIFGVIYSLYLINKKGFGDAGNAIYMSGYQIYALLLTISSIGIPNAISKIISEKNSIKDYKNKERTFKIALLIFATIGFLGTLCLFFGARFISEYILEIPDAEMSLIALSPAIFFVSISSVLRGYFNGENKILITAKSQFFEQVLKSIFTITFVEIIGKISNNNTIAMASVANFATTLSTFCNFLYAIKKYNKLEKTNLKLSFKKYETDRILKIIYNILKISVPITLCSILTTLGKNVDSITIIRILRKIIGEEGAKIKYGILSSKVDILIALPLAFNSSIAISLIPEIARKKDAKSINETVNFSLIITSIIAIPCMYGFYFFAKPIFDLLYPNAQQGSELLKLAATGVIFPMLTQTINAILQATGKNKIPVIAAIIGLIIKIIFNIILIPIKNIYEKGAIISNIISNIISFIIVYSEMKKNLKIKFINTKEIIKIILICTIMIFIAQNIYKILIIKKVSLKISALISIAFSIVFYLILIIVTKMLNKNTKPQTLENTSVLEGTK